MTDLLTLAQQHLHALCIDIPERPVGSVGNRRAAEYIRLEFQRAGWQLESQPFDCIDWRKNGAVLDVEFPACLKYFPAHFRCLAG